MCAWWGWFLHAYLREGLGYKWWCRYTPWNWEAPGAPLCNKSTVSLSGCGRACPTHTGLQVTVPLQIQKHLVCHNIALRPVRSNTARKWWNSSRSWFQLRLSRCCDLLELRGSWCSSLSEAVFWVDVAGPVPPRQAPGLQSRNRGRTLHLKNDPQKYNWLKSLTASVCWYSEWEICCRWAQCSLNNV